MGAIIIADAAKANIVFFMVSFLRHLECIHYANLNLSEIKYLRISSLAEGHRMADYGHYQTRTSDL